MVFELGLTATPRFNLREMCHPALARIAEATGDTVFLTQRSGLDAVCLDRQEGTFPIKTFTLEVGMRRPLGVGTGSLAILSALSEEEIDKVVGANNVRPAGVRAERRLPAVAGQARAEARLRDARDARAGRRALDGPGAAQPGRRAVRGLSVSTISSRMSEKRAAEIATLLKNETRQIERQISNGSEAR
jgi:DNA-binding IclR family transcriptional regulator